VIETYWHHTRTQAYKDMPAIKVSHRQRLMGGDSSDPHMLVEDIVLQSLEEIGLQNNGTEHEFPNLRRRK
jgi:hypothetical protein